MSTLIKKLSNENLIQIHGGRLSSSDSIYSVNGNGKGLVNKKADNIAHLCQLIADHKAKGLQCHLDD